MSRTSKIKNGISHATKEMSYSTVINVIVIERERAMNQCILINTTIAFLQIDTNFTLSPLMSKTSKSDTPLMVASSGNALKSAMVMIVQCKVAFTVSRIPTNTLYVSFGSLLFRFFDVGSHRASSHRFNRTNDMLSDCSASGV